MIKGGEIVLLCLDGQRSARHAGLRLDKTALCVYLILPSTTLTRTHKRTHTLHTHTDSQGRVVNFKNTIIILTSNLGAEHLQKAALDSSTGKRPSSVLSFLSFDFPS